jgi:hypothetical protein
MTKINIPGSKCNNQPTNTLITLAKNTYKLGLKRLLNVKKFEISPTAKKFVHSTLAERYDTIPEPL